MFRFLLVTMLVFLLCTFASRTALSQDSQDSEHGPAKWLTFKGDAFQNGDQYVLRDSTGRQFKIAKKYVRTERGKIFVENEVPADVQESRRPSSLGGSVRVQHCARQDDCPSKCCACIGLVRVCCGSGGTRGVCIGVWGCP
jgi:hypothetical protein